MYEQRFAVTERLVTTHPAGDLGLVVVIPCYNEPHLLEALDSLWKCDPPKCSVEVMVVINSSPESPVEVRERNAQTLVEAEHWVQEHQDPRRRFYIFHFPDLPPRDAGVGLARKIGVDEAARRLEGAQRLANGIIAGFDADCACASNYLVSLERHFKIHPKTPGCSVYFEHPLAEAKDPLALEAIIGYELHLRYYVQALRSVGFPYAHHTVGSSMAVRGAAYRKQGGMNKRKAGEDFYFLNKIIPLGGYTDLTETTVYPSSRPSDRVPFGTGKAVRDFMSERKIRTYPLESFLQLGELFQWVSSLAEGQDMMPGQFPEPLRQFLFDSNLAEAIKELRENTSSREAFEKRFFGWMNAFRIMKFLHYYRDRFQGTIDVSIEAGKLMAKLEKVSPPASALELLHWYRQRERLNLTVVSAPA